MKRTGDGRFIEKRVKIPSELLENILKICKKKYNFTWASFAEYLDVSEHTLRYDWRKKGNTIPLSMFNKIIEVHPRLNFNKIKNKIKILEPFWGQKSGLKRYKPVSLPNKYTEEFAEFYGMMLGDGCIYSNLSGLCISGDKILDKAYYENYLSKLLFNLFKIKPKIIYSKNNRSMRLILYSKNISKYLIGVGFPKGKKLDTELKIPNFILNNRKFIAACIRGLIDTDGSISAHPHSKIMLHFSSYSDSLRRSTHNCFNELEIKSGIYNKGIVFYGKNKLKQFFKLINSSNPKNIIKYKQFLKTGKVPSSKETEMLLKGKKSIDITGPWSSGTYSRVS